MANLNFQQPPRSIANASLSNRTSGGGFVGSSLSGHVTPTSGMFPPTNSPYVASQQQQPPLQLSPNRSVQLASMANNSGSGIGSGNGVGGIGSGIGGVGGIVTGNVGNNVGGAGPPQLTSSGRTNMFGQRTFADRRNMQGLGPMSSIGSFMQSRGYGSQSGNSLNNFHSVFGGGGGSTVGDRGTPPLLDLSEFPSLTNARGSDSMPQTNNCLQPPGSKPYVHSVVGMVKQPTAEQSEFTMSSEDFPALPGTQITDGTMSSSGGLNSSAHDGGVGGGGGGVNSGGGGGGGIGGVGNLCGSSGNSGGANNVNSNIGGSIIGADKGGPSGGCIINASSGNGVGNSIASNSGMDLQSDSVSMINDKAFKRGVQTSPDGKVTNIPASMVNNQFGMVGLLTFIRAAESDPNLVTLAMGQDLTGLGLNLNSQENLYPTFGGPFADQPCRPQDIDFHVPPEYLVNMTIRDKLATLTLKKYKDDLLFFLFYTNVGDIMQIAAAAELHNRDWRYHIEEKVWITRVPGITHYEKNGNTERGTFYYFDAQNWRRVPKDFQIDATKLDKCPNINAFVSINGLPV